MDPLALVAYTAFTVVVLWLLCATITAWIAHRRGAALWQWSLLGLLLGPIGIVLVLRLARDCPACGARVLRAVRTCPGCGEPIPVLAEDENKAGPLWTYRRDW